MHDLTLPRLVVLATLLGVSGCAFVSDDLSAEALKANAEIHTSFRVAAAPGPACAKTARMLMWCAGGPNYHYRCNTASDGNRAELTGVLEAVYRTEYFLAVEFVRSGADSAVTLHQRDSVLVYDYAPLIKDSFTNPSACQPR